MPKIILIDNNNNQIGVEEKYFVHEKGLFHRAFSILVFNSKNEILIQKRAKEKYHSGGLWTNTCCSHPTPNEILEIQIHNRLKEEMGFDCKLKWCFDFSYKHKFSNNLIENEFDHVFIGKSNKTPVINKSEVSEYKWISIKELNIDILENTDTYSYWFQVIINKYSHNKIIPMINKTVMK